MQIKYRIVFLLFVLFSGGSAFCQADKEPPLPPQQVIFGKFPANTAVEVSVAELLKADSLFTLAVNGEFPFKIVSFDTYTSNGKIGIAETAFGNRLSKKQKTLISNLKPGDMLSIQRIMIKYPGKDKVVANTKFFFKIKK